ncbi:MAG: zinc ABC transporter substrate-binding protein [Fibrobacteria bacterium]|nr:zinc ABC transporter substrate-binding protein [Fibrobacteria bacterium]
MKRSSFLCILACGLPLLPGCDGKKGSAPPVGSPTSRGGDTIRLAAATTPVAWLACRVVGPPCSPLGLVPPGASAHSWEPRPSDLVALSRADAWIRTGLDFEGPWTERVQGALPDLPVVDLRVVLEADEEGHAPHPGEDESLDPHVWSSPRAMGVLAETLAVRLRLRRPAWTARIDSALPRIRSLLGGLDSLVHASLPCGQGRTLLVNHPTLGYLARDCGMVQRSIEEHGRELSPRDLERIRAVVGKEGIRSLFLQAGTSDRAARVVASDLGIAVRPIDLMASPWDSAFRATLGILADGL